MFLDNFNKGVYRKLVLYDFLSQKRAKKTICMFFFFNYRFMRKFEKKNQFFDKSEYSNCLMIDP